MGWFHLVFRLALAAIALLSITSHLFPRPTNAPSIEHVNHLGGLSGNDIHSNPINVNQFILKRIGIQTIFLVCVAYLGHAADVCKIYHILGSNTYSLHIGRN